MARTPPEPAEDQDGLLGFLAKMQEVSQRFTPPRGVLLASIGMTGGSVVIINGVQQDQRALVESAVRAGYRLHGGKVDDLVFQWESDT